MAEEFGDEMIAAAVLDRVVHHSHVLVMGDSFRLRQKPSRASRLVEGQQVNGWKGSVLVAQPGQFLVVTEARDST